MELPQSQDEDVLMAHDRLVMGKIVKVNNSINQSNMLNSTATKSFISGSSVFGNKSKDDIFDDFICDLFSSKLNISNTMQRSL
jgi:hypothetical protein